jgi:hypothetical protein
MPKVIRKELSPPQQRQLIRRQAQAEDTRLHLKALRSNRLNLAFEKWAATLNPLRRLP